MEDAAIGVNDVDLPSGLKQPASLRHREHRAGEERPVSRRLLKHAPQALPLDFLRGIEKPPSVSGPMTA